MTNGPRAVVVGLGGDRDGVPELDWAAAEAQARKRPLHVVRSWYMAAATLPWESSVDRSIKADFRHAAHTRLEHAVAHLTTNWPAVEVEPFVVEGPASHILAQRSIDAEVTVLGSRHLGGLRGAFLGSVGTAVAAHAAGAVVVVRGPAGDSAEKAGVVVGVDGSVTTADTLAFGFDHASRHATSLWAVFCYRPDPLVTARWRPPQPAPARAERWLAELMAGWQEKYPDVEVHRAVIREHPVPGLLEQSQAEALLVVGSHAQNEHLSAMLGSVSQAILHHATCPVAVIHPSARS